MPLAQIYLLEGRTEEQKATAIEKVTDALCDSLGAPRETVRVILIDMPKANWGIGGRTAKSLGR